MGLLRLLLALAVVAEHCSRDIHGVRLVSGQMAVQSFYIISGFYMALVLNTKYPATRRGYRLFIANRFLRLYPVYLVVLALTLLTAWAGWTDNPTLALWRQAAGHWSLRTLSAMVGSQLLIFGQDVICFMRYVPGTYALHFGRVSTTDPFPARFFLLIHPAWSLAVELMFYLIAPMLVRRRARVLLPIIAATFALRAYMGYGLKLGFSPWTYRFFPCELGVFLLGAVGYQVYAYLARRAMDVRIPGALALTAVLAFVLGQSRFDYPLHSIAAMAIVSAGVPFMFALTRASRLDQMIGELSYPLYLCHVLVAMLWSHLHNGQMPTGAVLAGWSIVAAIVLWLAIDLPVERWRRRMTQRARIAAVVAARIPKPIRFEDFPELVPAGAPVRPSQFRGREHMAAAREFREGGVHSR